MWFSSLDPIVRVLLIGPVAYVAMVVAIRLSGKRVLSKLNAFDMVVTVALGSLLATILTSSDLALVTGLVGIALLLALQVVVSLFTSRLVKGRTVSSAPVLRRAGFASYGQERCWQWTAPAPGRRTGRNLTTGRQSVS